MSLDFFDPYAALALIEKKQKQGSTLATIATFATNKENQHVTRENDLRQGCDKLRQIESISHDHGECRRMSQDVASSCDNLEPNNINMLELNVADVANVATLNIEKPLFIDDNGNPLRCTRCKYARTKYVPEAERERPYVWHGLCLLDPNELLNIVGMDSRCVLVASDDCVSVIQ